MNAQALRRMSKKQLLQGMNLCLRNARSLLKEAELLARAGARRRALALGVLAKEEAGKVVLLTVVSHSDRTTASKETLKDLARVFRRHDSKLALLADRSWKGVLYVRRRKLPTVPRSSIQQLIRAHRSVIDFLDASKTQNEGELKLRALYVDVDTPGRRFRAPLDVPRGVLRGMLQIARSGIEDAGRLRDSFRRARTDALADAIISRMTKRETLNTLLTQLSGPGYAAPSAHIPQRSRVTGARATRRSSRTTRRAPVRPRR